MILFLGLIVLAGCNSLSNSDATATIEGAVDPTLTEPETSSVRVGKWSMVEQDGGLWVFGELLNTGWNAVHNIQFEVTLLDQHEQILRTGQPTYMTTLPAGDKGVFYIEFNGVEAGMVDDVEFTSGAEHGLSQRLYTNYAILDLDANEQPDGQIVVSGVVQNLGAVQAESVHVFVIGYSQTGEVVLVQHGISPLEGIVPGETWAFESLDFGGIGVSDPRSLDSFAVGSLP